MGVFEGLLPWNAISDLRKKGSRSTAVRLMRSRHVADLRLMVALFLTLLVLGVIFLSLHVAEQDFSRGSFQFFVAVNGAIATLFVSLFGWVYQTGSKRLGVVDLFACEVAAICRVYVVVGLADRLIRLYHQSGPVPGTGAAPAGEPEGQGRDPLPRPGKLTSVESYTPVMDRNVGDLQALDAEVVTNVTEFYTYRRAMMDYMQRWGEQGTKADKGDDLSGYFLRQAIYMLFLSLESARRALDDLIEFEPNNAEACINVLLQELPCYAFLMEVTHGKDAGEIARHRRLKLRCPHYQTAFGTLYHRAMYPYQDEDQERAWERARTTARDLNDCFNSAMKSIRETEKAADPV